MSEERDHNEFDPEPWLTDLGLTQMINALMGQSAAAMKEMMFPGGQAIVVELVSGLLFDGG